MQVTQTPNGASTTRPESTKTTDSRTAAQVYPLSLLAALDQLLESDKGESGPPAARDVIRKTMRTLNLTVIEDHVLTPGQRIDLYHDLHVLEDMFDDMATGAPDGTGDIRKLLLNDLADPDRENASEILTVVGDLYNVANLLTPDKHQ